MSNITKTCSRCKLEKDLSEFGRHKANKDGFRYECKPCSCEITGLYFKTKKGIVTRIYSNQKVHSRIRGDIPPDYTKNELKEFLFSKPEFHRLYYLWVLSGYITTESPSCDRIDDYKPYTIGNIQVMTWAENHKKGYMDRINGINNKISKSVIQMDKTGGFIAEYYSTKNAGRITGVNFKNIATCCRGKKKSAGGYRWMFSLGTPINNNISGELL